MADNFVKADSRNLPKVESVMLTEYIATSGKHNVAEIRGAKMLMSSRDSYLNTAIGCVEVKRNNDNCTVKAKVVPEHRVTNKFYTVTCNIDEKEDIILDSICEDCPAASGGCKHSLLLLFWLEKKTSEPSSTSVTCYWKKPTLCSARTLHVTSKDIFTSRKTPTLDSKNPNILLEFQEECEKRKIKNSLIVGFNPKKKNNSKNLFDLILTFVDENVDENIHTPQKFREYLKTVFNENVINNIKNKTEGQANNKYWHFIRQGRITASKIYEAAHCTTDGSLVEQVLGGYKLPETKAILRGRRLEEGVLKELSININFNIKKSGFVLLNGIIGASPDGVTDEFVVEIKCPLTENTLQKYIKDGKIKNKFRGQLQCQMLACGKRKGIFCVADPTFETTKKLHILWDELEENYINDIIKKAEIFWDNFIFPKLLKSAKLI